MHIIFEITLSTHISSCKKELQYIIQLLAYLSQLRHFLGLFPKYRTILLAVSQIKRGNSLLLFLGILCLKII